MNGALVGIVAAALLALGLGFLARRGRQMGLGQWTVAGRSFGAPLVFLLMAGEIYTTFTFLGGSGFAYGRAARSITFCATARSPMCCRTACCRRSGAMRAITGSIRRPDFFARKYDSPALGALVALVGIVALVPYLVLQLKGLGIIVETACYGAISATPAVWIGAAVVTAYVMVSGVRGSAWTAVAKDVLILAVVVFLGIYLPLHYYGGLGEMFAAIEAAKPGFLALPAAGRERRAWFIPRPCC